MTPLATEEPPPPPPPPLPTWQQIRESTEYFRDAVEASPYLHLWSLSVEEQFYVVWPLIVAMVVAPLGRRSARASTLAVAGLTAAAAVWFAVAARSLSPDRVYFGTDTRVYQILAGALLAMAAAKAGTGRRPVAGAIAAVVAATGLVVGVATPGIPQHVRGAVAAVAACGAIVSVLGAPDGLFARICSLRGVVGVGRVSYGMYLWHWPLVIVLLRVFVIGPRALFVVVLVGSFVLGFASYQLVERPAIDAARGSGGAVSRALVAAGVVTTVVVGLAVVPVTLADRIPVLAAASRPGFTERPEREPADIGAWTTLVPPVAPGPDAAEASPPSRTGRAPAPTTGRVPERPPSTPTPTTTAMPIVPPPGAPVPPDLGNGPALPFPGGGVCINQPIDHDSTCQVTEGNGERVLLLGDSHAADLIAMIARLADEQDLGLHVVAVVGCPWQTTLRQISYDHEHCAGVQAGIGELVGRIDPDVIVVAKHPTLEPGYEVSLRDGPDAPLDLDDLRAATRDALGALGGHSDRRIVVVEPRPTAPFDVPSCLSAVRTVDECAFTPLDHFVAEADMLRTLAAETPNVSTVDLRDLICPRLPICDPILNGYLVWRDFDHLTDGFVQTIQAAFAQRAGLS